MFVPKRPKLWTCFEAENCDFKGSFQKVNIKNIRNFPNIEVNVTLNLWNVSLSQKDKYLT